MLLRRRPRGEDGAVAVEAALVMLPLFLVVIGILEMSFLMRGVTAANSAVAAGARSASVSAAAGPCGSACSNTATPRLAEVTVDAIERSGTALPSQAIEWVMVYDADTNGMPSGQTGGFDVTKCTLNCVVYTMKSSGHLEYQSGAWNTTAEVNACVNDPNRTAVGVAIRAKHSWFTGFFGQTYSFNQRNVMQFEPLPNDSCGKGKHA